jgi:hypothetical protein
MVNFDAYMIAEDSRKGEKGSKGEEIKIKNTYAAFGNGLLKLSNSFAASISLDASGDVKSITSSTVRSITSFDPSPFEVGGPEASGIAED